MTRRFVQPPAQEDERLILSRSRRMFGAKAARADAALLARAYKLLCENPQRPGVQHREELSGAPNVFHLRHARRRGAPPKQPRHIIVFTHDDTAVNILRLLHDAMDLPRRLVDSTDD